MTGGDRSLTAPRLEGQVEALKRAYIEARIDPSTVGLVEAHGTGTVAGDTTEVAALSQVFGRAGALPKSCGLGSVKSMIGHTKGSAGVAGVMKVALSLHHKVLPPTLHVEKPNSKLREQSNPFFVSGEALPWLSRGEDAPRRGGVSSFGFGGTNFHAVLEEYTGDFTDPARRPTSQRWDSEILYWKATSADQLKKSLASLQAWLVSGAEPKLRDLASTVCAMAEAANRSASQVRLAIVSSSLDDLRGQLRIAMRALESPSAEPAGDSRGVYLMRGDTPQADRMAFLFPGQGSQYPYMLRDLSLHFPEFREHLERASQLLAGKFAKNLHHYVFPPPAYRPEDEAEQMRALTDTVVAQPALGAVEMGLFKLLARLGVKPDMTAGHSYGEYVALCAAGVLEEQSLLEISEIRGRLIKESTAKNAGKMLAVTAGETEVVEALRGVSGVWLANFNGPAQTIVAGAVEDLDRARTALQEAGLLARPVPVACAFHTPLMEGARRQLAAALTQIDFAQPKLEVFSNSAAQPYASNPTDIRATLAAHLVRPVQFVNEIEAMYRSGARLFVEVGPKSVLTNMVNQILEGRSDVCAISTDLHGEDGLSPLLRTLAQLKVRGVPVNFEPLFEGRALTLSAWSLLSDQASKTGPASLPWLVNGSGVRPAPGKTDASATATESTRSRPAGSKHTPPSSEHLSSLDILPTGGREESSPVSTPGTDTDGTMEKKKNEKTSVQPTEVASQPVHQLSYSSPGMDDHEKIMLRFQDLMSQFLQTQREVMTAYLQNGDSTELRPVEASREFLAAPAAHEEAVGLHTDIAQSPQDGAPLPSALPEVDGQGKQSHARPVPAPVQEERPDPPAESPLAGSEVLETRLVRLVSERTGYPPDMLGLDMNLEADLGIDSIKRVEILSAFERESGADEQNKIQAMMDQLTGVRTLQEIIDLLSGSPHPDGGDSPAEPPPDRCSDSESVKGGEVVEAGGVPRFTLGIVDAPLGEISEPDFTDRVFVITDDEMGVGKELSRKLAAQNARAVLLRHRTRVSALEPNVYGADLTQASQVEEVLRNVTDRHGPIRAVVHLLPLKCDSEFAVADLQEAQDWVRRDIKSLFNLAKSAEKDLRKNNDSMFMAVTATGGTFSHSSESFYSPTHGGVTAFIKTLVQEWPEVQFKAIDVEPGQQATQLSGKLWNELAASDDIVQVGYSSERRFSVVPQVSPLMGDQPFEQWGIKPQSDWVFLLTGGARGITAEISSFLARSFTPTLVLAGLSPTPVDEESSVTSGLTESADLKAALTAKLRESQASVRPVEVEQAYRRLLREREIRQNVASLRKMGAKVEYHQVDVRNEDGFGQMIDGIYDRHGRLDAVIHGAGIIEDKLLTDKTPESFDRVLHTKTDSAFTLMRKLRPETLKLLLFMSSVTATFGNRGQSDYGAANGILNSLAHLLSKRWQARVVALNWGPWDKHGMVSDEVRAQFLERGIQVIPPQAGVEAIAREIADTASSNAVVVVGDGPWSKQLGSSQSQLRVASG